MEAERYRSEVCPAGTAGGFWPVTAKPGVASERSGVDDDDWRLVTVCLLGGAPWGFTLTGGREHQEPLIITKVEDGSKAAAVSLQAGDELVNINKVPLSGYRQQAICLVKGSHKTLSLVVKRNLKMMDIVARKMPSESDVHVARSFLTKILRSSMRKNCFKGKNEPISRPHSWHATKFNESQSDNGKLQSPPTTVWHSQYDASSSHNDLSVVWEPTNLCRASDQFSSLGSMDSLEHVSHSNSSMEHLGGGKRDSAYSSFSTNSSTPDYTLSKSNATSTENVPCKVSQWDAAAAAAVGKQIRGESARQDDRIPYFQMPGVGPEALHAEDPAGSRHSTSSRTSFGPVWHVPEKKKPSPMSPPPPPPPVRSNSFAATKAHERGLVTVAPADGSDSLSNFRGSESRRSLNISLKSSSDGVHAPSEKLPHGQFGSNKQFSVSSSDVRHGQLPNTVQSFPLQQQQHPGGKAPPWAQTAPKQHSVLGYHTSLQELPTNGTAPSGGQGHRWSSAEHGGGGSEGPGQNRYFCVTTALPNHAVLTGIPEDKGSVSSPKSTPKVQYQLQHSSHSSQYQGPTPGPEPPLRRSSVDDREGLRGVTVQGSFGDSFTSQPVDQRRSLLHQDVQTSIKISPQTTPMLHSLSVCGDDRKSSAGCGASLESSQMMRTNRFATTLRNEIQLRKARLQKSRSAATLPDDNSSGGSQETQEDSNVWKSVPAPEGGSNPNTYKDHLKEAQARVLKATSFRRRDLEPVCLELPKLEPGLPPFAHAHSDATAGGSGPAGAQVARIGGRKRFPAEKKFKCFSEPDKIHEVGVDEELSLSENRSQQELSHEPASGTFPDRTSFRSGRRTQDSAPGHAARGVQARAQEAPAAAPAQSLQDQRRLGTFAEYEARWSKQRKAPENKATGRYLSADNIVEPGPEDKDKACFHERSRSSPSAQFYGQKISVPGRRSDGEYPHAESDPPEPPVTETRFPDGPGDCVEREKPLAPTSNSDGRQRAAARPTTVAAEHTSAPVEELAAGGRSKPNPPRCPEQDPCESSSSSRGSSSSSSQSRLSPTGIQPGSSSPPAHAQRRNSEPGRGLVDAARGTEHHPTRPHAQPPAPPHMERLRPLSPQKLSDKPPASIQDEDPSRSNHVTQTQSSAAKRVPVRIVHAEGTAEKETTPFLQMSDVIAVADAGELCGIGTTGFAAPAPDSLFCPVGKTTGRRPDEGSYMTTVGQAGCNGQQQQQQQQHKNTREEEQKREELARDIMGKDKSLADILDQSRMRTTMDLMEGLFPEGEQLLEEAHQRKKVGGGGGGGGSSKPLRSPEDREKEAETAAAAAATTVAMVTSSAYYSTSAPKAELLIKMKDMQEQQEDEELEEEDSEDELDIDLANKKQELIDSLSKKLQVLREARESLQEDILDNNALGEEVEARVQQVCKPNELDKFRMFVGDLDKVVSLLLSLSGRLARVENAINSLEEDATPEERRTLIEKRKLLIRQHEDAKELKENLDRRERLVYDILAGHLEDDGLTDYEHFVKMKSALIIEQRKLEDKIKLGEEQLKCLMDSLPIEQRLAL